MIAELKYGKNPDTDVTAIKYAAMASRVLPESLAEQYARFHNARNETMSVEEALADLQAHAPDLSPLSLRKPRIVLLARNFSPIVTASVVWLSEMGLDLALVQISAFRSYVYGQSGSDNVPMISVSQIYPPATSRSSPSAPSASWPGSWRSPRSGCRTPARCAGSSAPSRSPTAPSSPSPPGRAQPRPARPARRVAARRPGAAHRPLAEPHQRTAGLGHRQGLVHAVGSGAPHRRAGHRRLAATSSARSGGATRPAGP